MDIYVMGCSLTQINDGQRLPPVFIDIITDLVSTLFRTYDSAKYGDSITFPASVQPVSFTPLLK